MNTTEVCINVSREGHSFTFKANIPMLMAGAFGRAFSDACDTFIAIDKSISSGDKTINYIQWDMNKFRKVCRHKGDIEEEIYILQLKGLLLGNKFNVYEIGFTLDANGKVAKDDVLYITINRV